MNGLLFRDSRSRSYKNNGRNSLYRIKFFKTPISLTSTLAAGPLTIEGPKMAFVGMRIVGAASYFFVGILNFIFTPFIEIRIFEKNPPLEIILFHFSHIAENLLNYYR